MLLTADPGWLSIQFLNQVVFLLQIPAWLQGLKWPDPSLQASILSSLHVATQRVDKISGVELRMLLILTHQYAT